MQIEGTKDSVFLYPETAMEGLVLGRLQAEFFADGFDVRCVSTKDEEPAKHGVLIPLMKRPGPKKKKELELPMQPLPPSPPAVPPGDPAATQEAAPCVP